MITCLYLSVHFHTVYVNVCLCTGVKRVRAVQFIFCALSQWYSVCASTCRLPRLPWLLDERLCATPGLLGGQAESCCTSTTRGCNEPNVNSAFPEGKCDGIWEEHLLLVSRRLQRTTRVKQGSSPRRLASTSSTAWMIWRRYAVLVTHSINLFPCLESDNRFIILPLLCLLLQLHPPVSHLKLQLMGQVTAQFELSHPKNYPSNIWNPLKYLSCQGLISTCSVALLLFRILQSEMKAAVHWNPSSTLPLLFILLNRHLISNRQTFELNMWWGWWCTVFFLI